MPQSGGVAPPRARRRRSTPQAFGLDLEWEAGSARAGRSSREHPVAPRRVSGPAHPGHPARPAAARARAESEVEPESGSEPWFAALPADLLAPADPESAPEPEPVAAVGLATDVLAVQPDANLLPDPSWAPTYDPVTGRRTVTIRGRGAERAAPPARRERHVVPRHERTTFRADRTAMWAVLLGVLLVLVAVTSAHGATLHLR